MIAVPLLRLSNHGIVDKYIGDAIMALYNVPTEDDQHEIHACYTAIQCQQKLKSMHESWKERKLPALQCRIR